MKISVDHKTFTPGEERVLANGHRPPSERIARGVTTGREQSRLSPSSFSNGDFVPPAKPPRVGLLHVHERSSLQHDSSADLGVTLSACELQSMSREQVLRLLSRQQNEISRRETELSTINAGI